MKINRYRYKILAFVVALLAIIPIQVLNAGQQINSQEEAEKTLRIELAALKRPESIPLGVEKVLTILKEGAAKDVDIICFPETYLPGLRGLSIELPAPNQAQLEKALEDIRNGARHYQVAVIIGMEWVTTSGLENRAFVISSKGEVLGYQTKNQITPGGEEKNYIPDGKREIFTIGGVKFGIVICHEGWRYPETVRWAAVRGAQVVFQPQVTGSYKTTGKPLERWGESFYEKAMICRSEENTIYFASVNQVGPYQNLATSVINPSGECIAYVPYGK